MNKRTSYFDRPCMNIHTIAEKVNSKNNEESTNCSVITTGGHVLRIWDYKNGWPIDQSGMAAGAYDIYFYNGLPATRLAPINADHDYGFETCWGTEIKRYEITRSGNIYEL